MPQHVDLDPTRRAIPTDEIGAQIMTRTRLLLLSRVAAKRGDQQTVFDLADQIEEIGVAQFDRGQEELGERTLMLGLFYEELNQLTLSGKETTENVRELRQKYNLPPQEDLP